MSDHKSPIRTAEGPGLRLLWLAVVMLVLPVGCEPGEPVPVTRTALLPAATVGPAIGPGPVPTAALESAALYLSLSPWPLHGQPPFTASLTADFHGDSARLEQCVGAHWDFGDGSQEEGVCPAGEGPLRAAADHTYAEAGTYYPRLTVAMADGRVIESNTQTVVVAIAQTRPASGQAAKWGVWGMTMAGAAGALWWLRGQRRRWKVLGYAVIGLGLITFVPPFSYLPNPVGLAHLVLGSYGYDPRLPFGNRFVVAGDPTAALRPYLDGLLGQTGLDPLDPARPLARYDFVRVSRPRGRAGVVVTTHFIYDDGWQRSYDIPLYQANRPIYPTAWRYDGLGRLRAEHRPLAVPFAEGNAPVRLETPQVLSLGSQGQAVGTAEFDGWFGFGQQQQLVWSPWGDAFLARRLEGEQSELWLLPLNGGEPRRLAENVGEYGWSPDGRYILYTPASVPFAAGPGNVPLYQESAEGGDGREVTRLESFILPGMAIEGFWFEQGERAWFQSYKEGRPQPFAPLPEAAEGQAQVWADMDGRRLAYRCRRTVCLQDRDGRNWIRLEAIDATDLEGSWSFDRTRLAVAHWEFDNGPTRPTLTILERDGTVVHQLILSPSGEAAVPQWTVSGDRLFIQTFPLGGRRIITVDVTTGEALDLSQPRWDVWFAVAPDGSSLLLNNGRGYFWQSQIGYAEDS